MTSTQILSRVDEKVEILQKELEALKQMLENKLHNIDDTTTFSNVSSIKRESRFIENDPHDDGSVRSRISESVRAGSFVGTK